MKFNKNNMENFILLTCVIALMSAMLSILTENSLFKYDDSVALLLAITLVALTGTIYSVLIIKRINPKKYIYLSYSNKDKKIAEKISLILSEQFKKLSKYRFEIVTEDSIPFGNDMRITMQENLSKSDIVIIIVSPAYLQSNWCLKEFVTISSEDKRIIPIVTDSFLDLAKLPKDISNIKALSLKDCVSEESFANAILALAKDLIKQRKD